MAAREQRRIRGVTRPAAGTLRTLARAALCIALFSGPARAADVSPQKCARAVDLEGLKTATGAKWLAQPPAIAVSSDKLSCSFQAADGTMLSAYVRPDPGGAGEWKTRRALHRDHLEPVRGIGDDAFFILDKYSGWGLVARSGDYTIVLTGFPAGKEKQAKSVLPAMAKSLISFY
jgi:hypothetical protein